MHGTHSESIFFCVELAWRFSGTVNTNVLSLPNCRRISVTNHLYQLKYLILVIKAGDFLKCI